MVKPSQTELAREVVQASGVNFNLCLHCRCCASGCPFVTAMDYYPHVILRMLQLGLVKEVLESATIWVCVGCHTCSMECPMAIDMAAVMDALCQVALRDQVHIREPDIYRFHQEVLNSIERHGRTHKLEIMLRYKLQKKDFFSDMDVGLKMLAKRKLDLMPSKVKRIEDVRALFAGDEGQRHE